MRVLDVVEVLGVLDFPAPLAPSGLDCPLALLLYGLVGLGLNTCHAWIGE